MSEQAGGRGGGLGRALVGAFVALGLALVPVGSTRADSGTEHQVPQARTIALGTSGGNIADVAGGGCSSGTLGALVERPGAPPARFILSNNPVLARQNATPLGSLIVQPGQVDAACAAPPASAVALLAGYILLRFNRGLSFPANRVDAAIARVGDGLVRPDGAILDIGVPSNLLAADRVGCRAQKSGRTTGLTRDAILAVDVTLLVNYRGGRVEQFVDQFLIGPGTFSRAGDSGSVTFRDGPSPRAVGLLFAASPWFTVASPIAPVLGWVGASMVGAGDGTGDCPEPGGVAAARAVARTTKARHEDALLAIPTVRGVGLGRDHNIQVYLAQEDAAARIRIPAQLDGLPVRVIVSGEFRAS